MYSLGTRGLRCELGPGGSVSLVKMNTNERREDITMASKELEAFRSKMTPVPGIMFMFLSKVFSTLLEP